jgi:hypothetical protein
MPMNCERAAAVLRGLEKNQLVCEPDEIEELLTLGLAIECDPDDLMLLQWLQPVVREFTRRNVGDPGTIEALDEWLAKTNKDLASDWYRMTTSKVERQNREQDKVQIQRALGLLRDTELVTRLRKIVVDSQQMAPGSQWVTCRELGVEHYALTAKGHRVRRSLKVRLERFANVGFKSFLHSFDKTLTKMRTFGTEVTTLSNNIGYVKKNREQVVIGLAKVGVPAGHALGAFHTALREVHAPDVAVTCARNTQQFGSPAHAAHRLRLAQGAIMRAGYPNTPIAMGAAKSLLTFNPPDAGIPRFNDLMRRLDQVFGRTELLYKYTARLMPATGEPAELVQRVVMAGNLLNQMPCQVGHRADQRACAVALASMVKNQNDLTELVKRYRELEVQLVQGGVSTAATVEGDALECIACPGTPAEVVDTVAVLMEQLAQGRQAHRGDVAVAAAFAKRFAY